MVVLADDHYTGKGKRTDGTGLIPRSVRSKAFKKKYARRA